jgi:predicted nucleic acid-binding protein
VSRFVVDASIAVKWVVTEDGTPAAVELLRQAKLDAPELLVAECANILWKKVRRSELRKDEALLAAQLLQRANIELHPMRSLLEPAARIAVEIDHPAYDCVYLALAVSENWRFVTADETLLRKLQTVSRRPLANLTVALQDASALLHPPGQRP